MARGGRAWRGWFPVGGELTSGRPDRKEGIYFGAELDADHPRVRAGIAAARRQPLPRRPADLATTVLRWMTTMTELGRGGDARHRRSGSASPPDWFAEHLTADPTVLFRIFHYPPTTGRRRRLGRAASTPTTACSPCSPRTPRRAPGDRRDGGWIDVPPRPACSCATSATCSSA